MEYLPVFAVTKLREHILNRRKHLRRIQGCQISRPMDVFLREFSLVACWALKFKATWRRDFLFLVSRPFIGVKKNVDLTNPRIAFWKTGTNPLKVVFILFGQVPVYKTRWKRFWRLNWLVVCPLSIAGTCWNEVRRVCFGGGLLLAKFHGCVMIGNEEATDREYRDGHTRPNRAPEKLPFLILINQIQNG